MAAVTNENLGIVLPNFDAAYRAGIAATMDRHLPWDLACTVASYTIDEDRVARQRQYLSTHVTGTHPFWRQVMGVYKPVAVDLRITHLCVRTDGSSIHIYYVGEDMDPMAIKASGGRVDILPLNVREHNVRVAMPLSEDAVPFLELVMLAIPDDWEDAWGNAWIGEAAPGEAAPGEAGQTKPTEPV
jgi:hypothetical protein